MDQLSEYRQSLWKIVFQQLFSCLCALTTRTSEPCVMLTADINQQGHVYISLSFHQGLDRVLLLSECKANLLDWLSESSRLKWLSGEFSLVWGWQKQVQGTTTQVSFNKDLKVAWEGVKDLQFHSYRVSSLYPSQTGIILELTRQIRPSVYFNQRL